MSDTDVLVLLSVLLAIVVVAVARRRADPDPAGLESTSTDLATLAGALETVESEHLRPLEPAVQAINAQFDVILSAMPGIAAQGRGRRREEAGMTLWWIGDVLLIAVVLPVVVYLLQRRAGRGAQHRAERRRGSRSAAGAGSKDLDAVRAAAHHAGACERRRSRWSPATAAPST